MAWTLWAERLLGVQRRGVNPAGGSLAAKHERRRLRGAGRRAFHIFRAENSLSDAGRERKIRRAGYRDGEVAVPMPIHRPIARRRLLIALGAGVFAAPLGSLAQQQGKVRRIGFLGVRSRSTPSNPESTYDAFVQAMRELGYVEGKNLLIEGRFADGNFERLPGLAVELVLLNPEVIMTYATPATEALQRATRTIPIVTSVNDPVASGFAASLARPGGNITGQSLISVDVSQKHLEFLKAMVPRLSRVAVLVNPDTSSLAPILKSVQAAAQTIGVRVCPWKRATRKKSSAVSAR